MTPNEQTEYTLQSMESCFKQIDELAGDYPQTAELRWDIWNMGTPDADTIAVTFYLEDGVRTNFIIKGKIILGVNQLKFSGMATEKAQSRRNELMRKVVRHTLRSHFNQGSVDFIRELR